MTMAGLIHFVRSVFYRPQGIYVTDSIRLVNGSAHKFYCGLYTIRVNDLLQYWRNPVLATDQPQRG